MKSRITSQFRHKFADLPEQVKQQARQAYRQFKQDPSHPSLRLMRDDDRGNNRHNSSNNKGKGQIYYVL